MRLLGPCQNERGMLLITCLMFMAILSILGTTAWLTTSNELMITGNYKTSKMAFYDAEAGINYAVAKIEQGLADSSLSLTGSTISVNYTAPSGFSFEPVTQLTQVTGTNYYSFQVTGHGGSGSRRSNSILEVAFKREPALQYGVFGDDVVDMKANGQVYSYDSGTTPNPGPSDSTGEGDVGSNTEVIVHNGTVIDGNVGLGETAGGSDAYLTATGTPSISGDPQDVDRVPPDPLGLNGGALAGDFLTATTVNDNALAVPAIVGDAISLGNGDAMTLPAGDYYLTSVDLKQGSTLTIQPNVNIYLTGPFDAKNGSTINVNGNPSDFTLYSNSNEDIVFKHGSAFKGTVYAPNAHIEMKNSADVYGVIWGKSVGIKNSGQFYFDVTIKDKFLSNNVSIVSWRDVRG